MNREPLTRKPSSDQQRASRVAAGRRVVASLTRQPLVGVLVAVAAGIIIDRYWPRPVWQWWAVSAGALGGGLLTLRWRVLGAAWLLAGSWLALAAGWHHARWYNYPCDELGLRATDEPQPACVEALALSAPERLPRRRRDPLDPLPRGDRMRLAVSIVAARDGTDWRPASGRSTLVVEGHLLGIAAGDRLRIYAQLSRPPAPLNPGQFDFRSHLRADRQLCRLWVDHPACVVRLATGGATSLARQVDQLRAAGSNCLWQHLDPQRAGLAAALLLGSREQLDEDRNEAYFVTGLVHVLSISGLHVGLLAAGLFVLMRVGWLGRDAALFAVAGLIVLYAILIRAEPPAVRAAVAVVLACQALRAGRAAMGPNLLSAAALIVLAMNPADLFRAGPQLSFLCTLALIVLGEPQAARQGADPLDRLLADTAPWPLRWLRHSFQATLTALRWSSVVWLVALPLVLFHFQLVSPISLLLTPLTAVPTTIGLLCGFVTLICGALLPIVAGAAGWCCDVNLAIVDRLVQWGASVPGGHWWTLPVAAWWVVGCYAVGFGLWRGPTDWRRLGCWVLLVVWLGVGWWSTVRSPPSDSTLRATFLAVGHGCAVVLEFPSGRVALYDAGRLGPPAGCAQLIAGFLGKRRIQRLDAVFVSHQDVDHYNALPDLLERVPVAEFFVPTPMLVAERDEAAQALFAAIERQAIPVRSLSIGSELNLDPACQLRVLHPPHGGVGGSDNANSLVLLVEFQGRRLLLTGDLERPGTDLLLTGSALPCDVVLAPHHGSVRSDPPGFARWATPHWAIISGSAGRDHSAVDSSYEACGASVLHTARDGAVTVELSARGVDVSTFRAVPTQSAAAR